MKNLLLALVGATFVLSACSFEQKTVEQPRDERSTDQTPDQTRGTQE